MLRKLIGFFVFAAGVAVCVPVLASELPGAVNNSTKAEWVEVGHNDNVTVYADTSSISKTDNRVKIWKLADFKKTPAQDFTKPFKSFKEYVEFDCREGNSRIITHTFYADNMGGGEAVLTENIDGKWAWHNLNDSLFKLACGMK